MRLVMFCHSLVSDWNHGNAHFLRGVTTELLARGHQVDVYEPEDAWSVQNLLADHGPAALEAFARAHPALHSRRYRWPGLDLAAAVAGADVVLVHEWNDPALVNALPALRRQGRMHPATRLLFHDTHHRAVSAPEEIGRFDLAGYDAALVFGRVLREVYQQRRLCPRAFVWHEAADVRRFWPRPAQPEADLVWIGNWGDGERTREIEEFLIRPVQALGLRARVHGVRYPAEARAALAGAGIEYRGWLPNFEVPEVFARHRVTVHIPRGPYARSLPGIPTIRPFEALACGIPLVSAPWRDDEGLFQAGRDYLVARDGDEMIAQLRRLLDEPGAAEALAAAGLRRIREAHTCRHRVDELEAVIATLSDTSTATALEARP